MAGNDDAVAFSCAGKYPAEETNAAGGPAALRIEGKQMASTKPQGIQIVGTDASPIALGATGGATDVWTWTHNFGRRARKVEVLTITTRQPVTPASVVVTQPNVNSIVLTNTTGGGLNVVIEVTWEYPSSSLQAPEPASVGVLS